MLTSHCCIGFKFYRGTLDYSMWRCNTSTVHHYTFAAAVSVVLYCCVSYTSGCWYVGFPNWALSHRHTRMRACRRKNFVDDRRAPRVCLQMYRLETGCKQATQALKPLLNIINTLTICAVLPWTSASCSWLACHMLSAETGAAFTHIDMNNGMVKIFCMSSVPTGVTQKNYALDLQ